jgi:hypothetical protein
MRNQGTTACPPSIQTVRQLIRLYPDLISFGFVDEKPAARLVLCDPDDGSVLGCVVDDAGQGDLTGLKDFDCYT